MSVNWYWDYKKGSIVYQRRAVVTENNVKRYGKVYTLRVGLYGGNCLAAHILRYKEVNKDTEKVERMYNFWGFWNDIQHLRNCLKNDTYDKEWSPHGPYEERILKVKCNIYFPEMVQVAKEFAKHGFKVELFYEEC